MKRDTILIADDEELIRDLLKNIFEGRFELLEAEDGQEAEQLIEENADRLAVIFLDLMMPRVSGLDVMDFMDGKGYIDTIPVIMVTGAGTAETDEKAYEYRASDIIRKPFAAEVIWRRTMNIIELFEDRFDIEKKLEECTRDLREAEKKLEENNEFLFNALSSVIQFRSAESGEHVQRVKDFTRILMNYMLERHPEYHLTRESVDLIVTASTLHDIGKIATPDSILLKPGRLTKEEFEEMKKHTVYGCAILEQVRQEGSEFYRYCYEICRYHHERYDGRGYPDGLKGEEIPIWAQVVSIADVFDALVSPRVYKAPFSVEEAMRMINAGECGAFSDKVLECFNLAREDLMKAVPEAFEKLQLREEL